MNRRRTCLSVLVVAIVAAAAAGLGAQAHSDGAPQNAATQGCGGNGCHFVNTVPATLLVEGLPNEYSPGDKVKITMRVTNGPPTPPEGVVPPGPLHRGGFALQLKPNVGEIRGMGEQDIQDVGGGNWTHMDAQWRMWNVSWTPPPQGVGPVTFFVAANAVDGDLTNIGDSWDQVEITVRGPLPPPPKTNATTPTPTPDGGSPAPLAPLALLAVGAGAVVAARARSRA